MHRWKYCLWLLAATLVASPCSLGQVDYATATLQGTVSDPQDRVVAGAEVTAVNLATQATHTATTESSGNYRIPALSPGNYRVEVEATGFAKGITNNITLTVGQVTTCDVHLTLGSVQTEVRVTAEVPVVHVEQTQQANLVNSVLEENLPNVNREFTEAIYTLPGVGNSFGPALQDPGVGTAYLSSGFSIGGSNGRSNLVTIDGGENDYGSGALRVTHVPIDSVQEFQVNRNAFEAEFGFTVGSAINMVTKSGGNDFHGSIAGYFHDRATDSENYFNALENPGHNPFEQSAILSGTLGGPIRRNKLFFFTAYEYQRLDSATTQDLAGETEFQPISTQANSYSPSTGLCPNQTNAQQQVTQLCYLTQMANSGSPLAPLGAALLASPVFGNPLSNTILNALVSPNDGTFDGILLPNVGVAGIPGYATPRGRFNNWVTRVDYTPGAKDSFTMRFSLMRETDDVAPQPPTSSFERQSDYTLTGSWTRIVNSQIVNVVRAQVVPLNSTTVNTPSPVGSNIQLGNQIALGSEFGYPYSARWRRFQFDDTVSWAKGSHLFKFGGSYRPDLYSVSEELWPGGQWQFSDGAYSILDIVGASQGQAAAGALASYNVAEGYPSAGPASTNLTAVQSYLAGTPITLFQESANSNTHWSGWAHNLGLFAQDSWKALPRLTVNYGIRLDYDHEPSPVPQSVYASPRLGVAWDPLGDQKTVIRAGAGLFVAPVEFMVPFYVNALGDSGNYINQGAIVAGLPSPPFPSIFAAWALQESSASVAFPNPVLSTAQLASLGAVIGPPGPTAFGNAIFTLGPNFKPEYSIQSSLSVARELASNLSLEVGYLFYHSVHIEQDVESNFVRDTSIPIDPFIGPFYMPKPGFTAGEPNASIFQNNAFSSVGSGVYHALTVSLTRRFSGGLQFQANYTFSRAMDDTSDFSSLSAPFRPDLLHLDWAPSDFNITHNFGANAVYTTPFRAGQGGLMRRSVADLTVSTFVHAHTGIPFTLFVPGLSNGTIGDNANARPWLEGRNDGIGPGFASWDVMISKALFRRERAKVEVIVQAQNLLNRENFSVVNDNFPADPNYPLPGGGTLANGPYHVRGFIPTSAAQLSTPLAFTSAYPARQVSLALKGTF
jgi:Carboxypeptidase regulatory-like domain